MPLNSSSQPISFVHSGESSGPKVRVVQQSVLLGPPYFHPTSALFLHQDGPRGCLSFSSCKPSIPSSLGKMSLGSCFQYFYSLCTSLVSVRLCQRHVRHLEGDTLSQLMNGPIRRKLKIIPEDIFWGAQSPKVFMNMEEDFMKPVVSIVDELLEAGVNVTVYNGQLDLIVDTMGQEAWLRKLTWPGLSKFSQLKWKALYSNPKSLETSAFVKAYKNLAFYWILRAGHMVPSDQGDMALKMMRLVTQQE